MDEREDEFDASNEEEETQDEVNDEENPNDDQEVGENEASDDETYEIDLPGGGDIGEVEFGTPKDQDPTNEDEKEELKLEMSPMEAEIARVLDEGCTQVQQKLSEHFQVQKSRLEESAQQVQLAMKKFQQQLDKKDQTLAQSKLERDILETKVEFLEGKLQRQQTEQAEEREWLAELWPDTVPLPTLLIPIKKALDDRRSSKTTEPVKLVKDVASDHERQYLEALIARRVERERIRQQIQEASYWKVVLPEGEDPVPYYINSQTGVSAWDAPVAMAFEPPKGWNMATMDWEENFSLENFIPEAEKSENDEDEVDSDIEDSKAAVASESSEEEEDDEEDDVPIDPMPARERFEEELKRYEQLKADVEQSAAKQRSLAMEVLTAKRELFEREEEILKEEDAAVIAIERKRRIAEKEEQAAAKAKEEAKQRKAQQAADGKGSIPVFARDSVAKKGLTLAADDQVFEQELRDFAAQQRVDRLYLSMPLTRDVRVHDRHHLEPEFVHMKHVESRVLESETLEFDLLEKSSLRQEEAAAKVSELRELCEQIREQQKCIEEELLTVGNSIAELEAAATSPPEQPRPTEEELKRAADRFVTVDPLSDDEKEAKTREIEDKEAEKLVDSSSLPIPGDQVDDIRMQLDESELRELKAFTDSELVWRQWEKAEKVRNMRLNKLSDRQTLLTTSQKQLSVDLKLYEDSDAPFFERLRDLEKAANTRLWDLQSQTQVVRARFVVERAAREESVFQMRDRLKELQLQLEDACALPKQATHPLERLELEKKAAKLVVTLKQEEVALQGRYAKEEVAKALLVSLELKSCDYVDAKLQEETKLFAEKQALWDLNFTLADEMQRCRQTIERLELLVQKDEKPVENEEDDGESSPKELHEENSRVFESKLQYLQQVRRFLFLCYEREDRWRGLNGSALIKDTTSDEWMTNMQLSRQEEAMSLLKTQHEEQQQVLERQIKSLTQAKVDLQAQEKELTRKLFRLESDYQAASESVRVQTQSVIKALQNETEEHKIILEKEKIKFRSDREQLVREHDAIRAGLENQLQTLDDRIDKQTHWLTAAKRELHAQRVANEELLKAYQSLEKRRAAEVNDMRFRISAQIKKINNLEMWNLSMKISAKEAHTDFLNMQKEIALHQQQHKQLQRGLRFVNWRHRVTAQSILTDVNLLFSFFADGVEILAGASSEINDSLRENAGIEVLAALARHSSQQTVRAICARALGQLSWNSNATARSLGWKAKQKWFQWMKTQSNAVLDKLNVPFDSVADEEAKEVNWLADPSSPIDDLSGESDHDLSSKGGKTKDKKLLFTSTWQQFDDKTFPDTNVANQQYMGLSSNVLQTILDLCRSHETDKVVKRNALHSLALIVRSSRNTSIIGRLDGSIALLVGLLKPSEEDPQVVRHAVQALANLVYRNAHNQQILFSEGGIPLLLRLCERTVSSSDPLDADVDLTLATTQALSHLSHDHTLSCQAIVESRGISILTKLCNSPRIHDAIDLEVHELIQTYASQVIANAITLLDKEDSESDQRSYNVADFILEEQGKKTHDNQEQHKEENNPQKYAGVTTFVLMCASCNRNVAFHGAVVLGSIAQHDAIRAAIGAVSGMDALFLLAARMDDLPMVVQATWTLANLTWNRDNQYRVARYLDQLYQLCTLTSGHTIAVSLNQQEADGSDVQPEDPAAKLERRQQDEQLMKQIREHGLCILANSLFYNDANRQLVASHTDWMHILARNALNAEDATLENSARALCSLSYSDSIALQMGSTVLAGIPGSGNSTPMNGLHLFVRLCGRAGHVAVQQHGLFGVINMCLHDSNKTRMLEIPHGVDTLVNLSGHMNKDLCDPALEALELLADMRQLKQEHGITSTQSFESVDMKKLISLLSEATNPSLVAMISDAIADEVWKRPSAQIRLRNEHGLEKLLEICAKPSPLFPTAMSGSSPAAAAEIERRVRISCLWALRNTVANNVRNQDLVGALGGVQQLVSVFDRERQSEEVVEAVLAALIAVVMKHTRNSQQLVQFGLDMLIGLADEAENGNKLEEDQQHKERGVVLPPISSSTRVSPAKLDLGAFKFTPNAEKHLENPSLARELLHLVAPYNTRENVNTAPLPPDPKVRRMQQLQSLSASPVHKRQRS
ncbi:hypothetical protein P3T76_011231 [Phytophthora citrophthora]|uniref:WW domain-containing protein n=1 Tax=Phytophthora citrophthora TaxID=4793 RepID=A0AAD9GA64_9STRA|nr:hypothetical protein P3T76_011231 [Phytophthora citrophthora]